MLLRTCSVEWTRTVIVLLISFVNLSSLQNKNWKDESCLLHAESHWIQLWLIKINNLSIKISIHYYLECKILSYFAWKSNETNTQKGFPFFTQIPLEKLLWVCIRFRHFKNRSISVVRVVFFYSQYRNHFFKVLLSVVIEICSIIEDNWRFMDKTFQINWLQIYNPDPIF